VNAIMNQKIGGSGDGWLSPKTSKCYIDSYSVAVGKCLSCQLAHNNAQSVMVGVEVAGKHG